MLKNEVHLDMGSMIIARAYDELSTCRFIGFTVGPIPWTAMLTWCERAQLDYDVTNHLINVVRAVDGIYMRRAAVVHKNGGVPTPPEAPQAPQRSRSAPTRPVPTPAKRG